MIAFGEKPFRKEKEEVLSRLKQEMEERERKIPLKGSLHLSYDKVPHFTLEGDDGLSISVEGSQPVEQAKEKILSRGDGVEKMREAILGQYRRNQRLRGN